MKVTEILRAWKTILAGRAPSLSVEITKECPLSCPGCYAYGSEHLGGDIILRQVSDYRGKELVERFMTLVDANLPLHVSIVGGEPLVRFRELNEILPQLEGRLKAVLRARDFAEFDLDRAFATVAEVAAALTR